MSSIHFTSQQAYVATLAMRLGKSLPPAYISGLSRGQATQFITSGNSKLAAAQAAATAAQQSGTYSRPASKSQLAAMQAISQVTGVQPPANASGSGVVANAWLVQFGKKATAQQVSQVYYAWGQLMLGKASQQLALF